MRCGPACASMSGELGSARRASGPVRLEQSDRQRPCAGCRYRQRSLSRSRHQGLRSPGRSGAARWRWRRHGRRYGSRAQTDVAGHIRAMGLRLRDGLASLAKEHGLAIRQSGPPQMPLMLFEADADIRKGRAFCSAALRHGAFFHPQHNMFLSSGASPRRYRRGAAGGFARFQGRSRTGSGINR